MGYRRPNRHTFFPEPPFAGTETIVPIRNDYELWLESKHMRNCSFRYRLEVLSNCKCFYRMLAPHRATICLYSKPDGCWNLFDLRLIKNGDPDIECLSVVLGWLAAGNRHLRKIGKAQPPLSDADMEQLLLPYDPPTQLVNRQLAGEYSESEQDSFQSPF